jgi:hypothetical protein
MPVRIESQAEPLPGYKLIERLGGGGFGEVWKCEAPGGLHKAIKFVYGDLQAADEDGARAEQELKALSRVKTVHHPYILSLERYDIIEGQLMIVMELADRTLWDRYRECRDSDMPGLPREELLRYMAETAEALDLMNTLYQLQHLDIKPQNLFLVHNHVKVADFGLVKDLEGMMASVTGGVTPVYAAPETFDGWVSRFSDQYSLAIVYQELLTGQRPFTGTSIRQLVLQHLQATPELSALPAADRLVIARALAKKPEERFPSCAAMVQALRVASQPAPAPPAPELPQAPGEPPPTPMEGMDGAASVPADGDQTHGNAKHRHIAGKPWDAKPELPQDGDAVGGPHGVVLAQPEQARHEHSATETPAVYSSDPPADTDPAAVVPPRPSFTELTGEGVLRPALVIGIGHQGLVILRRLKQELFEQFSAHDAVPHIRLLYLDTDPDALQAATGGAPDGALRGAEVLLARLRRPSHYLKPGDGQQRLASWLNPKLLYRMPRQQTSAGLRALGRLAFVDNYPTISRRLQIELEACANEDALALASKRTGLSIRGRTPRVYVVAGLAGGTGGGMFIDLAYTARRLLRRQGFHRAEIVGLFLLPDAERGNKSPAIGLANSFAALTELNHFAAPDAAFKARYDAAEQKSSTVVSETGPPFQRCILLPLPEHRGAGACQPGAECGDRPEPAPAGPLGLAGRWLLTELVSPLGAALEHARLPSAALKTAATPIYQTFGMYRLLWPRRQLLQHAARELCRQLVQRWMNKDAKPLRDSVQKWVEAQWEDQGLSADQLIVRLQEDCEKALGQPPEALFAFVAAPLAAAAAGPQGRNAAPAAEVSFKQSTVMEAMDQLDQLVGMPDECRPTGPTPTDPVISKIEETVRQAVATAATEIEQHLAELLVRLIEEPAFRLAGAEEAIRQFNVAVEKALQHQEQLGKELQARAVALYQRMHELVEGAGEGNPLWKTPGTRRSASERAALVNNLLDLVRSYPKCRYQSLIMQHLTDLYVSLRGLLSEQMREIGFCRQRLVELANLFNDDGTTTDLLPAAGRCLFPGGCGSLKAAVSQLENGITPADMQALDQRVQGLLQRKFRALVHVCTASSTVVRTLAPAMQQETESFLADRLGGMSVTAMYLAQHAGGGTAGSPEASIQHDLVRTFDEADIQLAIVAGREVNLLAVPPGPGEQAFRELAKAALPEVPQVPAVGSEEILLYREQIGFSLADLKQLGPAGRDAYQQMAALEHFTPHSRTDITEWRRTAAASEEAAVAIP